MAASNNFIKAEFRHESEKSKCLSSSDLSTIQRNAQHSLHVELDFQSKCESLSYGNTQWEVAYKDNSLSHFRSNHSMSKSLYPSFNRSTSKSLHLSLLSGAASANVNYLVYVEYYEDPNKKETAFSSGLATLRKGNSVDLKMDFRESKKMQNHSNYFDAKTFIEFYILCLDPVVEIPKRSTLSAVLSSTLDNDKGLNDVMLYFGPGKELVRASKFMLMARSPVFKIMFEADMKEAESNEVTIDDITPAVGKEMIAYIYTDKAPGIKGMAEELWFAAEKYQLPGLKALCENECVRQLKTDNAAHFLLFAGRYCGDGNFKDYVLSFITTDKNTCSQVMKSDEWKEVKKFPEIAFAVSDTFFDITAAPATKRPAINTLSFPT